MIVRVSGRDYIATEKHAKRAFSLLVALSAQESRIADLLALIVAEMVPVPTCEQCHRSWTGKGLCPDCRKLLDLHQPPADG